MILCIGTLADKTFCHTLKRMQSKGVQFDTIDTGFLCYKGKIHFSFCNQKDSHFIDWQANYFHNYSAIYSRIADISTAAPTADLKERALNTIQALSKYLKVIDLPVINRPLEDQSNFSKFFHSVSISEVTGWQIPRSCLTNLKEEALNFYEECKGQVIYKGCSSAKTWASKLAMQDLDRLNELHNCPVLFQECIEGPDVRVHVVDNEVFPELISSEGIDYRLTKQNRYQKIELPEGIAKGCRELTKYMRTPFLGIDFKIDKRGGGWYFLEANNLPCYEGYDLRQDHGISDSIIQWLLNHSFYGQSYRQTIFTGNACDNL